MFDNTRKCVSSFAQDLSALPRPQQEKVVSAIVKFTGADSRSVRSWFDDANILKGVRLIKIRHMLVVSGRKIATFEAMPTELKTLCGLIAHDAINPDDVFPKIGYPSRDEFFRPITEGSTSRTVSPERITLLEKFLTEEKGTVHAVRELDANPTFVSDFPGENQTVFSEHESGQTPFSELVNLLSAMKLIVATVSPSVSELVEARSSEDRMKFRELFGTQSLFELSNQQHVFSQALNALCSEKTREIVLREKK